MPFSFTFSVPGLSNPFSKPPISYHPPMPTASPAPNTGLPQLQFDMSGKQKITRRRPSPAPPLSAPTSRKRGWEPAFVEPSLSTTTLASSSGYLDTPAKYRDMANNAAASGSGSHLDEFHEAEMIASDIGKRVSTPLSPRARLSILAIYACPARAFGSSHNIYPQTLRRVSFTSIHSFTFSSTFHLFYNVFHSPPPSHFLLFIQVD